MQPVLEEPAVTADYPTANNFHPDVVVVSASGGTEGDASPGVNLEVAVSPAEQQQYEADGSGNANRNDSVDELLIDKSINEEINDGNEEVFEGQDVWDEQLNSGCASHRSLSGQAKSVSEELDYLSDGDDGGEFGCIPRSSLILVQSVDGMESIFENLDEIMRHEHADESVPIVDMASTGNREDPEASLDHEEFVDARLMGNIEGMDASLDQEEVVDVVSTGNRENLEASLDHKEFDDEGFMGNMEDLDEYLDHEEFVDAALMGNIEDLEASIDQEEFFNAPCTEDLEVLLDHEEFVDAPQSQALHILG